MRVARAGKTGMPEILRGGWGFLSLSTSQPAPGWRRGARQLPGAARGCGAAGAGHFRGALLSSGTSLATRVPEETPRSRGRAGDLAAPFPRAAPLQHTRGHVSEPRLPRCRRHLAGNHKQLLAKHPSSCGVPGGAGGPPAGTGHAGLLGLGKRRECPQWSCPWPQNAAPGGHQGSEQHGPDGAQPSPAALPQDLG